MIKGVRHHTWLSFEDCIVLAYTCHVLTHFESSFVCTVSCANYIVCVQDLHLWWEDYPFPLAHLLIAAIVITGHCLRVTLTVVKHHGQSKVERKRFVQLKFPHQSSSSKEVRTGTLSHREGAWRQELL